MFDITDSLKRLKRIGDEHSESEEILDAARAIEETIVQHYHFKEVFISPEKIDPTLRYERFDYFTRRRGEELKAEKARVDDHNRKIDGRLAELGLSAAVLTMDYLLYWERKKGSVIEKQVHGKYRRVSSDRETALKFSLDLANGLLRLIELDLQQRQAANESAPASLQDTQRVLPKQV
jgi:hypothetical protein